MEDEETGKLQWMQDAMNVGYQHTNWLVLTSTVKELKHVTDPSMADYWENICAAIHELHNLYKEMG